VQTDDVQLRDLTSLRVGGPAGRLVTASGRRELLDALAALTPAERADLLVLGGGSNLVVADAGVAGVVLRLDGGQVDVRRAPDGIELDVDAGVGWDDLVAQTVELGGTGLEMMSGIPGRVGAAPIQNIAAYGQQVCDATTSVEVVDRATLEVHDLAADECGFGFRTSRFKGEWRDRFVIARVRLRLADATVAPPAPSTYVDIETHFARSGGDPTDVAARRAAVLATRRTKSMVLDPDDPLTSSAGSFFVNPTVPAALADELAERFGTQRLRVQYLEGAATGGAPAPASATRRIPAAHLLRAAGFNAGDAWGTVQLSDKHVLALVTRPGATALDVWNVGSFVRHQVERTTGVALAFEPVFVGAFPPFDLERFLAAYAYEPASGEEPAWLAGYRDQVARP
jgi:UDP-N-acetylmuramate dehydrogenase